MARTPGPKDYEKQELDQAFYDRAKAECEFSDRLYEVLLAYQRGEAVRGRPPEGVLPGNVGDLNARLSQVYNQIWSAALGLNKKKKQEVIA